AQPALAARVVAAQPALAARVVAAQPALAARVVAAHAWCARGPAVARTRRTPTASAVQARRPTRAIHRAAFRSPVPVRRPPARATAAPRSSNSRTSVPTRARPRREPPAPPTADRLPFVPSSPDGSAGPVGRSAVSVAGCSRATDPTSVITTAAQTPITITLST